jgi:monoamine oxidase
MMENASSHAAFYGRSSRTRQRAQIAVIGGGPSGLMTAYLLERRTSLDAEVTLFEASGRLGGKMRTRCFDSVPASYEAGVAECYDLHAGGPDPLRDLVQELCLTPVMTHGNTTLLKGAVVRNDGDLARHFGAETFHALREFRRRAVTLLPPAHWRRGFAPSDARHPMAGRTAEDLLNSITDAVARRYVKTITHSDLATEPHLTSGLIGLSNVLKSVDGYGAQYTFEEGVEMLPRRLAERLRTTRVELDARVVRLSVRLPVRLPVPLSARLSGGGTRRYTLDLVRNRRVTTRDFDAVVLALPYNQLLFIELDDERLRRAMTQHVARYEPAAHYLRVSMLFRTPFWRSVMTGSWFMLDAFGGCCVYDEGAHRDAKDHGVLGWLLAGTDALVFCNADERALVGRMLDALPPRLRTEAYRQLIEVKVHRWAGGLSARPGGADLRDPHRAHRIDPKGHPRLVVVGDYLFDSTLNGVLRSAGIATGLLSDTLCGATSPEADMPFARTG